MNRPAMLWWLAVGTTALALKAHYRAADAADLSWVLAPLALLLELTGGHRYERMPSGEWHSVQASIALVKGCAGINFMVMSLLAWGRSFAPHWRRSEGFPAPVASLAPFLGALVGASLCAWGTALVANLLRILLLGHVQPLLETWLSPIAPPIAAPIEEWLSPIAPPIAPSPPNASETWVSPIEKWLSPIAAHRLGGLAVYLGMLTLQVAVTERLGLRRALAIAAAIQAGILVLVPLLTGGATLADPHFRDLAGIVLTVLTLARAVQAWRRRTASARALQVPTSGASGWPGTTVADAPLNPIR